jgi:hypothetical protein
MRGFERAARPDPFPLLAEFAQSHWDRPQPDQLFAALSRALQSALGHILFTVLVHDVEGGALRRLFSTRPDVNPVGGTKPVTGSDWMRQVLQRGEPYIGRSREDLRVVFSDHERLWSIGCESVLNMPIVWSGRVVGSLNLLDRANSYVDADVPIARLFAQLSAPALLQASPS